MPLNGSDTAPGSISYHRRSHGGRDPKPLYRKICFLSTLEVVFFSFFLGNRVTNSTLNDSTTGLERCKSSAIYDNYGKSGSKDSGYRSGALCYARNSPPGNDYGTRE